MLVLDNTNVLLAAYVRNSTDGKEVIDSLNISVKASYTGSYTIRFTPEVSANRYSLSFYNVVDRRTL